MTNKRWKTTALLLMILLLILQGFTPTVFAAELDNKPNLNIQTNSDATTEKVVVQVQLEGDQFDFIEIKLPKGTSYNEEKTKSVHQQGVILDYNAKKHVITLNWQAHVTDQQAAFVLTNLKQSDNSLAITGKTDGDVVFEKEYSFQVKQISDRTNQQKDSPKNELGKEEKDKKPDKKIKKEVAKTATITPSVKNKPTPKPKKSQGQEHNNSLPITSPKNIAKVNTNWPNPGSLKLTKEATPTGKYGEWEIELTAQGKKLKQKSDVVLVFDRSNTMEGRRLYKAKQAAQKFVDHLLTEDSTTRIALVPFGTYADKHTDFTDYSGKRKLKRDIHSIYVTGEDDGATNIQAGLHKAKQLLNKSVADYKTIVLLSDGDPTFSFRAKKATPYMWSGSKYNFILSDFDYAEPIGTGGSYYLEGDRYRVNGFKVKTNGIATMSEAAHIINSGIDIYSIGLDVARYEEAIYVLKNSQNRGYYEGSGDELKQIFTEIGTGLLNHAAHDAIVTDPLGEMFNLVEDGSYNGQQFTVSHGNIKWNDRTETFTWNIGSIKENECYTLKYKINMDWDKHPKGNELYPTNGETPLNYKDPNGHSQTKLFPIPKVGIDKGKIVKKGYRVNLDGKPVDKNGNVVSAPSQAEQFYKTFHKEKNQEELKFYESYDVFAEDVKDYTLYVGKNPTKVKLKPDKATETVWFGYIKTSDLIAGNVTAIYVDEAGNEIAEREVFTGKVGDTYITKEKDIPGYEFVKVDEKGASATGEFKKEPQIVRYIYKKKLGTLTVIKVGEQNKPLKGATFVLKDKDGNVVETAETGDDGKITFENLEWGNYQLEETKAPEDYRLLKKPIDVQIKADQLNVERKIKNSKSGWSLPDTGGIGTILFYLLGAMLMIGAWLLFIKKKQSNASADK